MATKVSLGFAKLADAELDNFGLMAGMNYTGQVAQLANPIGAIPVRTWRCRETQMSHVRGQRDGE